MSGAARRRRDLSWIPALGAILFALVLIGQSLWAIAWFWDVYPVGDMIDVLWRYIVGPARDFWIFHDNEHLPLAVMPVFWIDFIAFKARGGFLIVCTVLLACAIALAPLPALRRARPREPLFVAAIACCSVAMQLWLGGYINLLWTKQVHMYVSLFAVVTAIGIASAARPRRWYHAACACAWAAIAMFSFGYGITAFPVLAALGLWRRWPWRWLAMIASVAVLCLVAYLSLSSPILAQHGRVLWAYRSTAMQAMYALTFVASPIYNALQTFLPRQDAFGAAYVCAALASGAFLVHLWRGRHHPPSELTAWAVGLALFTVLTAIQTALARSFFGFAQAADSRYIVGQIPFWLGILLIAAQGAPKSARGPRLILGAAVMAGAAALLVSQQSFLGPMRVRNYERWSSAMSAIDRVHDPLVDVRDNIYHITRVAEMTAGLRARGWSAFSWRQARWIGRSVPSFGEAQTGCLGAFDTLVPVGRGSGFRAEGWAADSAREVRSAWVLLADQDGIIRGVAHGGGPRADVTSSLHAPTELYSGWTGYVPAGTARPGLAAWLLVRGKHPCRLGPLPSPPP